MGKGSGDGIVTGYKYRFALHLGFCRGPIDQLVAIKVDDLIAWDVGATEDSDSAIINKPDLFGGDEKEGGLVGGMSILMGKADQKISERSVPDVAMPGFAFGWYGVGAVSTGSRKITEFLTGLVSSFRGVFTIFYRGQISANNPYPKAWKARLQRGLKGWANDAPWYPEKAVIFIDPATPNEIRAMNGAHILYECITNKAWGRGFDPSMVGDSFISAANTLCDERFGLCMTWKRSTPLSEFMQSVIDHVGAAFYLSRVDGKFHMKLIRDDYDADQLPVFDGLSGVLDVEEDQQSAGSDIVSEQIVTYHSTIEDADKMVRATNLAAYQSLGSISSKKADYSGIPHADLALRVAARDLRVQAGGLRRFTVKLDRRAWKLQPGDVFRMSYPSRGVNNIILRIGEIQEGEVTDGSFTIKAVQDVFGLPATTYNAIEVGSWSPPDRTAVAPTRRYAFEASYRDVLLGAGAATVDALPVDSGAIVTIARRPTGLSPQYGLYTRSRTAGEDYAYRSMAPWTPTATLKGPISPMASTAEIDNQVDMQYVTFPCVALINLEMVRVDSYDPTTGVLSLGRGCVDTLPQDHPDDARVWFYQAGSGSDERDYVASEVIDAKILTRTSAEQLPLDTAAVETVTIQKRFGRPYVPGALTINGAPWYAPGIQSPGDIVFEWASRNRITQADQLVDNTESSIAAEAGTTYTVRVLDGDTVLRTVTGIVAETWTYDTAMATADGALVVFTVELMSVRDGLASWSYYHIEINRAGGFNKAFNRSFNGGV